MKRWIVETRDERSGGWNLVGTVVGPADAEAAAMAARREIDAVSTEAAVRVHDWWECPEGFQEAASRIDERNEGRLAVDPGSYKWLAVSFLFSLQGSGSAIEAARESCRAAE